MVQSEFHENKVIYRPNCSEVSIVLSSPRDTFICDNKFKLRGEIYNQPPASGRYPSQIFNKTRWIRIPVPVQEVHGCGGSLWL